MARDQRQFPSMPMHMPHHMPHRLSGFSETSQRSHSLGELHPQLRILGR